MKGKIFAVVLSVLVVLAGHPLFAQQGNSPLTNPFTGGFNPFQGNPGFGPMNPQQPFGSPLPFGNPSPFGNSFPLGRFPGQSYFPQGMVPPAQGQLGTQPPPFDLSQGAPKYCGWAATNQLPPSYFTTPPGTPQAPFGAPPTAPHAPQTVPVQGPWLSTSAAAPTGVSQIGTAGAGSYWGGSEGARSDGLGTTGKNSFQDGATPNSSPQGSNQPGAQFSLPPGAANNQVFYYEPFSTIEAAYQSPPFWGERSVELRQYGYALFANPISTFAPVMDVPVGPDYILGPGDDLTINVWGAMESGVMRTVDRNGQIILPAAGPVRVWGLSFSQAERLIREQLARYYHGFQTNVTMGRLRTIRVYVVGEVCQPGSFTLSSLSTVTNALFAAGGPLKLGSLREIQIKRNHHTVGTVDLYDFLLQGDKTRDFRLESGDTIFVPPVGATVAVTGEVKRPAIYELKGSTSMRDLIEMAGGVMPQSYLKRVQLIRTKPNAEKEVIDLDLTSLGNNGDSFHDTELRNGDIVKIYPTDSRVYNTVTLSGSVKHPGEYELKNGMKLSQLLTKESALPEAYVDRVEIARLRDDLTVEIMPVSLKKAWEGDPSQDIGLKSRDHISVKSEYRSPWRIALSGEVKRPGIYTVYQGERLSSVLQRAGGLTDEAFPKGAVFTRLAVREIEKKKVDDFIKDHEQRLLAEASQLTATVAGLSKEEAAAQQAILVQRREQVRVLASKMTLGRVVMRLDDPAKLAGSPDDIALEDGDSLHIPQKPATVLVMGSVRNPTGILHREDMDVQYYLNRAGGLTPEADAKGLYLLKADGSAITGFVRLRNIEPGDVVIVPPSTEAKTHWLPLLKDLATIAGQVAIGLAGLVAIF